MSLAQSARAVLHPPWTATAPSRTSTQRRTWCPSFGAVSTARGVAAWVNESADKYDNEAHKFWDKFYQTNTTHFFKDRHWLTREFPELLAPGAKLLEVGCGVGNTIFPLLQENNTLYVYGIDFAPKAISLVKVAIAMCRWKHLTKSCRAMQPTLRAAAKRSCVTLVAIPCPRQSPRWTASR